MSEGDCSRRGEPLLHPLPLQKSSSRRCVPLQDQLPIQESSSRRGEPLQHQLPIKESSSGGSEPLQHKLPIQESSSGGSEPLQHQLPIKESSSGGSESLQHQLPLQGSMEEEPGPGDCHRGPHSQPRNELQLRQHGPDAGDWRASLPPLPALLLPLPLPHKTTLHGPLPHHPPLPQEGEGRLQSRLQL